MKWVNGTVLHYWFLDAPAPQKEAVRKAFQEWKNLGIGLEFMEVAGRSEAEVRIVFDRGTADTVLVLFEEVDGELRFVAGADDSGEKRNSRISAKLFQERRYVVRVRLYWAGESGQTAIMHW